jgi:hypothetical protein
MTTVHHAKIRFIASLRGGGEGWRVRDLATLDVIAHDLTRAQARALATTANEAHR